MPKLFGVDIAGEINRAMGSGLLPASLIEITEGTRDPDDLSAGRTRNEIIHPARGFIEDYDDTQLAGTLIEIGDRQITLLGASIKSGAAPQTGWQIVIEGGRYTIIRAKRDPAGATYICQVRG